MLHITLRGRHCNIFGRYPQPDHSHQRPENGIWISDLGEALVLLGLHMTYTSDGIDLTQERYIGTIHSRFGMENSKTVSIRFLKGITLTQGIKEQPKEQVTTYQSMIGSLMSLVTGTRPDLAYTISFPAQFSSCPTDEHINAAKNFFRYVNRTRNLGLFYPYTTPNSIDVYVDADFAGCQDTEDPPPVTLLNSITVVSPSSERNKPLSPNQLPKQNSLPCPTVPAIFDGC